MFLALSFLNAGLLVLFWIASRRLTGPHIASFFAVYYFFFFLFKPYGQVFFGLGVEPSSEVLHYSIMYQICGSMLLCSLLLVLIWSRAWRRIPFARVFTFPAGTHKGYLRAFVLCLLVSYAANVIRLGSPLYFLSAGDLFAKSMALVNGLWFINVAALTAITCASLAWISSIYDRYGKSASFGILLVFVALIYIFGKPDSRTGLLVIFLAWLFSYPGIIKKGISGFLQLAVVAVFCVIFMLVYGLARTGGNVVDRGVANGGMSSMVGEAAISVFSDLRPADNALMLMEHFHYAPFWHFQYLAGAITPLCLVPSKIFPFKLPADKEQVLTETIFPNGVNPYIYHFGSTLTFTLPASGYTDFGWAGVVVACILYSMFYMAMALLREISPQSKLIGSFLLLNHIAQLRISIEGILISLYVFLLFFGIVRLVVGREARETG